MRKLNQFLSGGDEEKEESLLDEESDDLCSLSPTQVSFSIKNLNFDQCFPVENFDVKIVRILVFFL